MSDVRFTGEYLFEEFLESHQAAAAKRRLAIRVVICIVAVLMLVQESWIERSLGLVALAYAFFVSGWIFRWLVKLQWSAFRAANKQTAEGEQTQVVRGHRQFCQHRPHQAKHDALR